MLYSLLPLLLFDCSYIIWTNKQSEAWRIHKKVIVFTFRQQEVEAVGVPCNFVQCKLKEGRKSIKSKKTITNQLTWHSWTCKLNRLYEKKIHTCSVAQCGASASAECKSDGATFCSPQVRMRWVRAPPLYRTGNGMRIQAVQIPF